MSETRLSLKELQESLSSAETVSRQGFSLLKNLALYINDHGEVTPELQRLLLLALEHRTAFGPSAVVLNALVREAGLFPYLDTSDLGVADSLAYEIHRPANMPPGIVFHRAQARVYHELMRGKNVILSAPTSFGKSLVIDAIISSGKYRNIVVIVPSIALIDETRKRLCRFQSKFKIITHAGQTQASNNIFVLTQERFLEMPDETPVDFFVIDEFYKLQPANDGDERCALLNHAFYRLLKKGSQFYLLGPGITGVVDTFGSKLNCVFIKEEYETVVSEITRVTVIGDEVATLTNLCKELTEPTIIFCSSPSRASAVAMALVGAKLGTPSTGLTNASQWVSSRYHPEWHFARALRNGIGVHHARIPRALSQHVVRVFNDEMLRFLVCTSTLIEGVNTKAKNIIIFDHKINKSPFDLFTFNNIRGRSGRMFQHFVGRVYLFHDAPQGKLPVVDFPIFTQSPSTPESLLIQMDSKDLTLASQLRVNSIESTSILSKETLTANAGIDPRTQIDIAKLIDQDPSWYRMLNWKDFPQRSQLEAICGLIWNNFGGMTLGAGSARTSKQLATMLSQLGRISIANMITNLLPFANNDPDEATQRVVDFIRLWANFNFPKFLRAIDRIQREIYKSKNLIPGNYAKYAAAVEGLFIGAVPVALDEYGIPIQLSRMLWQAWGRPANLDAALRALSQTDPARYALHPFEAELLTDAQRYLPANPRNN